MFVVLVRSDPSIRDLRDLRDLQIDPVALGCACTWPRRWILSTLGVHVCGHGCSTGSSVCAEWNRQSRHSGDYCFSRCFRSWRRMFLRGLLMPMSNFDLGVGWGSNVLRSGVFDYLGNDDRSCCEPRRFVCSSHTAVFVLFFRSHVLSSLFFCLPVNTRNWDAGAHINSRPSPPSAVRFVPCIFIARIF